MIHNNNLVPGIFSLPNPTHLVPLDQANFPNIRYWKKEAWTASGNENVDLAVPSLPSEPKRRGKQPGDPIHISM
ncbi:hypothetical protein EWM64_g7615 [Hericium alpestre]|uniref:Uncharacterized protein n=1 Tax=Hericium alpestre TaxID=135208 RepID=A0A4Y9ZSE0_9AGAM|nr:hypothetical protein EWM64_g7615 [Hericium alpestre]